MRSAVPRRKKADLRLRILFITPFPPDLKASHGGARAIAETIQMLARNHSVSVLYLRDGEPSEIRDPPSGCDHMIGIDNGSPPRPRRHLPVRAMDAVRVLLGGAPNWVRQAWSPEMAAAAAETAGAIRPDVVHFEFHVMAQYIPLVRAGAPNARCIVTEHEPALRSIDGPRNGSIRERLRRFVLRLGWARYERRALSSADAIVTFTPNDEEAVRALVEPSTYVTCIPLRLPVPIDVEGQPINSSLLFVGSFRHPPNADAALRLANSIFPGVRKVIPDASLCIVGPDPPQELASAPGGGLEVTGLVEDVAPYMAGAAVVICPLRLGGGMRVKVLEACAFGKALIASPHAVEGLGLRAGVEFVAATTDDEFVEAAIELLCDRPRRAKLGEAARKLARRMQNLDDWASDYDALYDRLKCGSSERAGVGSVS